MRASFFGAAIALQFFAFDYFKALLKVRCWRTRVRTVLAARCLHPTQAESSHAVGSSPPLSPWNVQLAVPPVSKQGLGSGSGVVMGIVGIGAIVFLSSFEVEVRATALVVALESPGFKKQPGDRMGLDTHARGEPRRAVTILVVARVILLMVGLLKVLVYVP